MRARGVKDWPLLVLALVAAVALAGFGCRQEFGSASNVTVLVDNGQSPGGSVTGPAEVCAPVASVRASCAVGAIVVGQEIPCDATPLDALRRERPDACNLAEAIQWTNSSPTVCDLPGVTEYTPLLTGAAAGVCVLQAVVAGVPSPAVTVVVQ